MTGNTGEIAVLLCTYNGARFLADQLKSITLPADVTGHIFVSDDGSSDDTLALLNRYARETNGIALSVRPGPGQGHRANFLSLLCAPDIKARYFAFCDQDDRWHADKLSRALHALERLDPETPAIYCSRTCSLSSAGQHLGASPLFKRAPAFANALIHNIAGGNTMVLNASARALFLQAGDVDVVMHDWWVYLLVSGAGGRVIYDAKPTVDYRQHEVNLVGANLGIKSRVRRYLKFFQGRNRNWSARNLRALRQNEALLTPENRVLLQHFERLHDGGLLQRVVALRRGGFYAQTLSGNIGLLAATLLKKI